MLYSCIRRLYLKLLSIYNVLYITGHFGLGGSGERMYTRTGKRRRELSLPRKSEVR